MLQRRETKDILHRRQKHPGANTRGIRALRREHINHPQNTDNTPKQRHHTQFPTLPDQSYHSSSIMSQTPQYTVAPINILIQS